LRHMALNHACLPIPAPAPIACPKFAVNSEKIEYSASISAWQIMRYSASTAYYNRLHRIVKQGCILLVPFQMWISD